MSLLEQPIYRSIFSSIRVISEGKCQAGNLELTVFLLKWDSPRINSVMHVLCNVHRPRFTPTVYHQVFSVSMDFKKSQHVFISANKCRHVTSLITALFPKCTTVTSSAVCSRREKGQRFTVVKYESNAVDIFILLHSMVNRCKNPEIHAVARSELNSWVGYLVNFISNRFLSYKTHI